MRYVIVLNVLFFACLGCGVKGDPMPPESPAYIGRGHPTYRKAADRFEIRTESIEDEEGQGKESTKDGGK
jgi:hypothetical protein